MDKAAVAFMLRLVNFIPWNWRICLPLWPPLHVGGRRHDPAGLDCWYMRLSRPGGHALQQFYDHEFGDAYMADRFQSMTIVPSDAVRG
ncbi:MAG: hypothetical protein ACLSDQ_01105 [Adlercreutzia equolifaciens]